MKTKSNSVRIGMLTVAILALGLAQSAMAQVGAGKFTLSNQVRWVGSTLRPGDYSFSIDSASGASILSLERDNKKIAFIMAQAHDPQSSEENPLVVKDGAVRELRLGVAGCTFYYSPSNPKRGSADEERMAQNEVIPVSPFGRNTPILAG